MAEIHYILRLCTWDDDKSYSKDYPVIFETPDKSALDLFMAIKYPNAIELKDFSKERKYSFDNKLPYLHLTITPLHKHSYIVEYSTDKLPL